MCLYERGWRCTCNTRRDDDDDQEEALPTNLLLIDGMYGITQQNMMETSCNGYNGTLYLKSSFPATGIH